MEGKIIIMHALTPLHTGIGQAVDVIDLPIAREKATAWPYIPGSSIKGVLRDEFSSAAAECFTDAFGPDSKAGTDAAGSLLFCDGHLLALPVRSYFGTFAWVTCPAVLQRLNRDLKGAGIQELPAFTTQLLFSQIAVSAGSELVRNNAGINNVYLEDYDLTHTESNIGAVSSPLSELLFSTAEEKSAFIKRFAVVSNDLFTFLSETATEVTARICIDEDTKVVKTGALWYEESIPAEAFFWSLLLAQPRGNRKAADLFNVIKLDETLLQIGGHAGVGRGVMRTCLKG